MHCLIASQSQSPTSETITAVATAAGTFLLVLVPLVIALWRGGTKLRDGLRDNTRAVADLTDKIEGNATAFGLERRVTDLEHWRIAEETRQSVRSTGGN